jgi:hypothetical protein
MAHETSLQLPVLVASTVDLGRLQRELDALNEALIQLGLRKGGEEVKMPKTSQMMDEVIGLNKLNLLHEADRQQLGGFLAEVKAKAPVLHMSFSADPSVSFIERLMTWLRKEINPFVLITIGLQPTIGAGCIVRSTNHQFDLSLRQDFLNKRDLLMSMLTEAKEASA